MWFKEACHLERGSATRYRVEELVGGEGGGERGEGGGERGGGGRGGGGRGDGEGCNELGERCNELRSHASVPTIYLHHIRPHGPAGGGAVLRGAGGRGSREVHLRSQSDRGRYSFVELVL